MSENLVLHMPTPQSQRPSPLRGLRWLILLTLFATAGAAAWLYTGRMDVQAEVQGQLLPITPLMTARVLELLVSDGQMLKAGQVLAKLDGGSYARQEAEARALVRGVSGIRVPGMQETAERVAQAQAAEEYNVRRVALARHEEESQHLMVEQRAQEHAQAQLRMRDLDARGGPVTAKTRQEAQQTESLARRQWEQARVGHETASRTRAAVEAELRKARAEAEKAKASGFAAAPATPATLPALSIEDPTSITAPQDGRLIGTLPPVGHVVTRNEAVARLAPAGSALLGAVAYVPRKTAQTLRTGQHVLVHPVNQNAILVGEVDQILAEGAQNTGTVPVRLRIVDDQAATLSAHIIGKPARVIIWSNTLPGLDKLMPLLAKLPL